MRKATIAIKPLPPNFFTEMLNIEMSLQSRVFKFQDVDKLIQLYAQAVEYYDYTKDHIKMYFMEKMQVLLINKEALRVMIQEQERIKSNQKHSESFSSDNNDSISEPTTPQLVAEVSFKEKPKIPPLRVLEMGSSEEESDSEEEKSPQRNRKVFAKEQPANRTRPRLNTNMSKEFKLMMKIEDVKKEEKPTLDKLVNVYEDLNKTNDRVIKDSLNQQHQKLRERISQRKVQNFNSQIVNVTKMDKSMETGWSSLLAELTEEEKNVVKPNAEQANKTQGQNENTIIVSNLITKKDPEVTPKNNSSQILDFMVSPIHKKEEDNPMPNKRNFFPSKNNPTYKETAKKDGLQPEKVC